MNRMIDADALIEDCKKYLNTLNPDMCGKEYERISWLIGLLENVPTIKPKSSEPERKTGKWMLFGKGIYWQCDQCNWSTDFDIPRKFCPQCGARMEMAKG